MMTFTLEDIHDAYRRFKSYVYYDNSNLHLRYKIAEFETKELNGKLQNLCVALNRFCDGKEGEDIDSWIREGSYIILPKSEEGKQIDNGDVCILTNKSEKTSFGISKVAVLYDGPIELFIIATIWTVRVNPYLHISADSYGYVLPSSKHSRLLYEPYFRKYQEWRDKGINAAKQQIEQGNNVLFITLDIKNYFHSVQVDFRQLKSFIPKKDNQVAKLTDIIEQICIDHTKKVYGPQKHIHPILPIGLPSSGVIANWILSDFDKDIKNSTAPVYYGRYVDDIFLVVANVEPPTKDIIQWMCERFFSKCDVLEKVGDNTLKIKSNRCEGLEIQKKKLRLFYFDAHWSLALLNKFQTTLQENSSAFWFLPNEEDLKDSLDDTYDLQYEDTINKFRSISSCKLNKYGASVFLAKRLKLAILSPGNYDKKLSDEIFRFFNGQSVISMYSMWEKVFTYFTITHAYKSIQILQKLIYRGISKIELKAEEDSNINDIQIENVKERIQQYLRSHMLRSLMLAKVFVKQNIGVKDDQETIKQGAVLFKKALMIRHFYLPLPIFALTRKFINEEMDITSFDTTYISDNEIDQKFLNSSWLIPRHIWLHEICSLQIPCILNKDYDSSFYHDNRRQPRNEFISSCMELFRQLNGESLTSVIRTKKHKLYSETKGKTKTRRIYSEIINVGVEEGGDKIKVGLSNVNTNLEDINEAILHRSILDVKKRMRHIDILNLAEKARVDILLLPEVFVPFDWLCAYADEARRKQRAMIFGLEHFSLENTCYNIAITLLPFEFHGRREALIVPRLKNHYSPREITYIEGCRKQVPHKKYSIYHLFQWRGIQFSVYNCFELTDIVHRSIFRSELDILFAIEYNLDVNYFSNISESVSRDLHCYYIQANTSYYGDSRVVEPKKTEYQNPVRVKGGDNDVILSYTLDIAALRKFQAQTYLLQEEHKQFKKTPPDFQHEKVEDRGKFSK